MSSNTSRNTMKGAVKSVRFIVHETLSVTSSLRFARLARKEIEEEAAFFSAKKRQARKGTSEKSVSFDESTLISTPDSQRLTRCQALAKEDIEDEARVVRAIFGQTQEERKRNVVAVEPRSCTSYHISALAREEKEDEARAWAWIKAQGMRCSNGLCAAMPMYMLRS